MRTKLFLFARYYLPGSKAGGPIITLSNLVNLLSLRYDCKIITSDRDHGCSRSYNSVHLDSWNEVNGSKVYYASGRIMRVFSFIKLIRKEKPDFIYLNSLFDIGYTFLPIVLSIIFYQKSQIIVAPRGELNLGALKIKSTRKKLFLPILKFFVWLSKLVFQATNHQEIERISTHFPHAKIMHMENFSNSSPISHSIEKKINHLKMVLVSRISPMKNVDFLMDILLAVAKKDWKDTHIKLDIYGFIEDESYWAICKEKILELPDWILVEFKGSLQQQEVSTTISRYHLFIMPTRGENFGHSIAEALAAGTPVLISDKTPWNMVEKFGAGRAISLDNIEAFVECINDFRKHDRNTHANIRQSVNQFYKAYSDDIKQRVLRQAHELFV